MARFEHERPTGFYASGVGQERDLRALAASSARGMVNARRLSQSPKLRRLLREDYRHIPMALDSGAFGSRTARSRPPTLDEYDALLREWAGRFDFTVNLDVLIYGLDGKPVGAEVEASDRNWRELIARGHNCLYVYHPNSDPRSLKEATDHARAIGHRRVAIGGLVPFLRSLRSSVPGQGNWTNEAEPIAVLNALGAEAEALGITLHLLGVGSPCVLRACSPSDWFGSADATSWIFASRNGRYVSSNPFTFGSQVDGQRGADSILRARLGKGPSGRTFSELAAMSLDTLVESASYEAPLDEWGLAEDDYAYALTVTTAERFGCTDDTEAVAFIEDVLGCASRPAPSCVPSLVYSAAATYRRHVEAGRFDPSRCRGVERQIRRLCAVLRIEPPALPSRRHRIALDRPPASTLDLFPSAPCPTPSPTFAFATTR